MANLTLVLIVPLWNWNEILKGLLLLNKGFNCTFMELKFNIQTPKIKSIWRFNCTFMELKFIYDKQHDFKYDVLIVPLWNWNRNTGTASMMRRRVLIVPLWNWNTAHPPPPPKGGYLVLIVPLWNWNSIFPFCFFFTWSFNCTFMELKWTLCNTFLNFILSFNCTFMELK